MKTIALLFLSLIFLTACSDSLDNEIYELLDDIKYCEKDNQCFVDDSIEVSCPFDCYVIRSNLSDDKVPYLKEKLAKRKANPGRVQCSYGCLIPPNSSEIACIDNECRDTRFEEKYCRTDSDCVCHSGNTCGCYNKEFNPPSIDGFLCEANCKNYPCVCHNNVCQTS